MEDFGPKHALSSSTGSGWIKVHNPFDGERSLFLSYMASGYPYLRYPTTQITITSKSDDEERPQDIVITTTLKPEAARRFPARANVVLTSKVAVIPPGFSAVYWTPLERAEKPFRITAAQIVSVDVEDGGCLGPNIDYRAVY
eukprot:11105939-Ditylum_brightwellii.AAC.1